MISMFAKNFYTILIGVALLSACSRPVAYFQRQPVQPTTVPHQTASVDPSSQAMAVPTQSVAQANTALEQLDAYVRQDTKLATSKTLAHRMARVKTLFASATNASSGQKAASPGEVKGLRKAVLQKLNRQLSKQLAPSHAEKAMLNTGKLIGGIVLLVVGLILLIAGTGTVAFIGLIVSLLGALGVIVGLIGI